MALTCAGYRDIRKGLGMSQPALSELLDVHWMTISKRERGLYGPVIKKEAELAIRMVELQAKYDIVIEDD